MDFQGTLFDTERAGVPALDGVQRRVLSRGAWVDVRRNWLPGADDVFTSLVSDVPWRAERRQMYDRVVDVPRLLSFYDEDDALPDPVLGQAREALSRHYASELREPFRTAGLCYYGLVVNQVSGGRVCRVSGAGSSSIRHARGRG